METGAKVTAMSEEVLDSICMHWPPRASEAFQVALWPDRQPLKVVGGTTTASQLPRLPST